MLTIDDRLIYYEVDPVKYKKLPWIEEKNVINAFGPDPEYSYKGEFVVNQLKDIFGRCASFYRFVSVIYLI